MDIEILAIAYDSGHENLRLGRGPAKLLEAGLADLLQRQGHHVTVHWIREVDGFQAEIKTTFALCRRLAEQVRRVTRAGKFSLVLSGNCFMALGAIAGLGLADLGIVWFDAHGEYNTPETTTSGYLDGMGLSTVTGDCWGTLAARIPEFTPMPADRVLLVGGHDFDAEEKVRLVRSNVALVKAADVDCRGLQDALRPAIDQLKKLSGRIYVHIDLDVLDRAQTRANELSSSGGMSIHAVAEALALLRGQFEIAGVGLAGYDPMFDQDGSARAAAFRLLARSLDVPSNPIAIPPR